MDIRLIDVESGYGGGAVLKGLSLSVASGAIVGILGRNGMGKSTLVRTLSGLNAATRGQILLGGEDITHLPPHARSRLGISTIVQGRGIFPGLTVRENLEMGRLGVAAGSAQPPSMKSWATSPVWPSVSIRRRAR